MRAEESARVNIVSPARSRSPYSRAYAPRGTRDLIALDTRKPARETCVAPRGSRSRANLLLRAFGRSVYFTREWIAKTAR